MKIKFKFNRISKVATVVVAIVVVVMLSLSGPLVKVSSQSANHGRTIKGQAIGSLLSTGGAAARQAMLRRQAAGNANGPRTRALAPNEGDPGEEGPLEGYIPTDRLLAGLTFQPDPGDPSGGGGGGNGNPGSGRGTRNTFVNDPCLDPPPEAPFPENFRRTVQSETEIGVLNRVKGARDDDDNGRNHDNEHSRNTDGDDESEGEDGSGKLMVAGYNDSYGFYNNTQGLSGFSYSTNGGKLWIDGGGLPPIVKAGLPAGTPGQDAYFGDPVVVVHHRSKIFYYASIYQLPDGTFSLAVNRGKFRVAPPQGVESKANTRCEGNPAAFGVPDPPAFIRRRVIWEPPVVAVPIVGGQADDFIDKEWLYVDQRTGELYLAYVRFGADGSTPLELVRSFDGGRTWTPPSIIVPNLDDTFNTGVQPITTVNGRVIVSWFARTFPSPAFVEREQRIEAAFSDNDGLTFSLPVLVARVNPQGEPPGYNRRRSQILNAPYIAVDKGKDDGASAGDDNEDNEDRENRQRPGFGNVYITYFDGLTPLAQSPAPPTRRFARAAEIHLSTSTNNGMSYGPEVKVNDDNTQTSHVFPSVQVNKRGTVFVTWIDRRVDPVRNLLNDTWGAFSNNQGRSFDSNFRITNVSTDWIVRADAEPNFGDYNSSEVINFDKFVSIWADGRFPPPAPLTQTPSGGFTRPANRAATPDTLMAIVGNGASGRGDHDDDR